MIPADFPEANATLAMGQNEYEPMKVYVDFAPESDGLVVACFRLSPAEIEEIVRTKTLWLSVLTFGHPFQPVALSTQRPFE